MASFTSGANLARNPLTRRDKRPDRKVGARWQDWPNLECEAGDAHPESLQCSRPDLEDESLIEWGLRKSKGADGKAIEIDVLHGDDHTLGTVSRAV